MDPMRYGNAPTRLLESTCSVDSMYRDLLSTIFDKESVFNEPHGTCSVIARLRSSSRVDAGSLNLGIEMVKRSYYT